MKISLGALCGVFALLVQTAPALALETVLNEPVKVTTCDPVEYTGMPTYSGVTPYFPHFPGYYFPWYGYWYEPPVMLTSSATLTIHYANQTEKVMKVIQFGLVANGMLVAEVRDVGTFSPGVEIKHDLPLSTNVFPLQTGLPLCMPLEITFDDGTLWRHPSAEQMRRQTYEPALEPESEPQPWVSPTPERTVRP